MPLTWTVTDRANRVWFYLLLLVGVAAGGVVLWLETNLAAMVVALVALFQAWRLGNERTATVTADADGITKRLGRDTWRREWSQVHTAGLRRVWGSHQLVLTGAGSTPQEWSFSNKLAGLARIGRGSLAVQVPSDQVAAVRELLDRTGRPQT